MMTPGAFSRFDAWLCRTVRIVAALLVISALPLDPGLRLTGNISLGTGDSKLHSALDARQPGLVKSEVRRLGPVAPIAPADDTPFIASSAGPLRVVSFIAPAPRRAGGLHLDPLAGLPDATGPPAV